MTEARSLRVQPFAVVLAVGMLVAALAVWQGETTYTKYLVALLGAALAATVAAAAPATAAWLRPGRFLLAATVIGLALPLATILFAGVGTYTMAQFLWIVLVLLLGWMAPRQGLLDQGQWPGAMAWAVGGASVIGLLQAAGVLQGGFDTYGGADAPSVFGLSNFSIEFVVPLIPLMWPGAQSSGRARIVRYVLVVLALAYTVASGSRAAILGLGAAAMVWGLVARGARIQLATGVAAVAAVAIFVVLRPGASDAFRLEAWQSSLHVWLDNPLGVGLGWFADAVQSYLTPEALSRQLRTMHRVGDPHNELIRLLVELGPLGAALLFALLVHTTQRKERLLRDPALAAALAAWASIAMVAFPGHTVSGALSAGLIVARWREGGVAGAAAPAILVRRAPAVAMALVLLASALPAWQMTRSAQFLQKAQYYMRRAIPLPANAVGYFRDAVRAAPYDRTAQIGLMTVGYSLRDFVVTAKTAENYLNAPYVAPDSLIQGLVAAIESRNASFADTWFVRHRAMIDRLPMIDRMTVALTMQQGRRYTQAVELLAAPDILATTDGRLMLAQALFDLRQYDKALQVIDEGLALPGATMGLRIARSLALEHLGRLDEAQSYLEQLVAERPQYAQTYLHLARLSWLRKDEETTWKYVSTAFGYDQKLRVDPNKETDPLFRDIYQFVAKRLTMEKLGNSAQHRQAPPRTSKKK